MQRVSAALLIRGPQVSSKQEPFGPGFAQQRCALQRVRDTANHIRSAVHVPVHRGPCHVPEPEVPLSRPKPTARLIPVLKVTLMLPASATRPDAETTALLDAI
jgi:hypothetical protein